MVLSVNLDNQQHHLEHVETQHAIMVSLFKNKGIKLNYYCNLYMILGGSCFATNTSESCMCQMGFYGAFCEFSQSTTSSGACRNTTCYNG